MQLTTLVSAVSATAARPTAERLESRRLWWPLSPTQHWVTRTMQSGTGVHLTLDHPRHAIWNRCVRSTTLSWPQGANDACCQKPRYTATNRLALRVVRMPVTHAVLVTASRRAVRKAPGARWVNGVLANVKRATSGRYKTVKQGNHLRLHSAAAWYHFDRPFHLAAMLLRLMYAAMLCNPWPEQVCKLSETFMSEQRNLIRCVLRTTSMRLVVQRQPEPIGGCCAPSVTSCNVSDDYVNFMLGLIYHCVNCV